MSAVITALLAAALVYLGLRRRGAAATKHVSLADKIDDLLPQTQCTQCGYPGCRPYAEAIAQATADINQCPPGGDAGVRALARLLGVKAKPINTANGTAKRQQTVAVIDETSCIGCTLCIQACPVDAILGASKQMHTVIADECTGCELCIAPCPVDCIRMIPVAQPHSAWSFASPFARRTPAREKAARARRRHQLRSLRLARDQAERAERLAAKQRDTAADVRTAAPDAIRAAVERARAKREARAAPPPGTPVPPTHTTTR